MERLFYELGLHQVGFSYISLILILLIILIIFKNVKVQYSKHILSEWQKVFQDFNTPTLEFYSKIQRRVEAHSIPKSKTSQIVLKREGGLFSPRRKYLQFGYKQFRVYICAGHFGKSNFFSSRLVGKISLLRWIILKIPILNLLIGGYGLKPTFYRSDAQYSALTLINSCVFEEIEELTGKKVETPPQILINRPELKNVLGKR